MKPFSKLTQALFTAWGRKPAQRDARPRARGLLVEALEPRLLLSASLPGIDTAANADTGAVVIVIVTDKPGYAPGETAFITVTGLQGGEAVNLQVARGAAVSYSPWSVVDGSDDDLDGEVDGSVKTSWAVPVDSPGFTFEATATGALSLLSDDALFEGLVTWVQAVPTDYVPGDIANIFAGGFEIGESVLFQISNLTNNYEYTPPWSVIDGGADDLDGATDGHIQTGWLVPQDALNTTLRVDATGATSGLASPV